MSLLAEILERVLGEPLELVPHGPLGRLELLLERLQRLDGSLGDHFATATNLGTVDAQHLTLVDEVHQLGPDVVDKGDAGGGYQQRPDVSITPRYGARRAEDGSGLGLHELFGSNA